MKKNLMSYGKVTKENCSCSSCAHSEFKIFADNNELIIICANCKKKHYYSGG